MAEEKQEKYSSIFEAASKIERKKVLEKVLSEDTVGQAGKKEASPLLTNEEIAENFEKYTRLHNLLADELEQAFVKNNFSLRQLRDYFNTSKNFTDEQWRLVKGEKDNIENMLSRLLPEALMRERGDEIPEVAKPKQKKPKKMQVKSRWMPMH